MTSRVFFLLLLILMPITSLAAPKYPLKTKRMIFSDEEIAAARENVTKYPAAKKVADQVVKEADKWLAFSDEELVSLITSSEVPRAFETGTGGCPKCGHKIYEKAGQYGWIIDPKLPFKVKCPVDGSVYPTNDYAAYYKSGFKDKKDWDTKFVDDGWGYQPEGGGEKFWFVAYYNHWMWHKHLSPAVRTIARAYLLTGDKKYAHKAEVMLHRMAEVYPAMDHAKQSRYGSMMAARGIDYPGKVVNAIWETGLIANLAEAYDDVWETISDEKVRADIEANLLEDGINAVFSTKIRGNFGMHQSALVYLGLARQFGDQAAWFDGLLQTSTSDIPHLGLNYALYNLIYRDGVPSETAPGYNFIWVSSIAEYGELLQKTGRNVFEIPKTKRLFDAVIDQINIKKFTPSEGDSGNVYGAIVGQNAQAYQMAHRAYHDPRYARFLASFNASGEAGFKDFETLLHPPIETTEKELPPQKSRLLAGYGMAILSNPADTNSLSLYYGLKHGHGHFDRMNFELFANGKPIIPNLGYPDAMNDFVPGIYTWSKNTIAHNTVTVDAAKQPGNTCGTVHLFADSPTVRVVDVDGNGTYPQCSQYRRAIIMIDVDETHSYFVDFFNVAGGKQHDYVLHGPPGECVVPGVWKTPEKGTLAGENVALGEFYDAPAMGAKGYADGFGTYGGSGFQHLFNVQKHMGGECVAIFSHEKGGSNLRIRVLEAPGQTILQADAHVSPVKYPQIIKYLIARRTGENLQSEFVSVIEPYKDKPIIRSVSRNGNAIEVTRVNGEVDVVTYIMRETSASVITRDPPGEVARKFSVAGKGVTGEVVATDARTSAIHVKLAGDVDVNSLVDRVVNFSNEIRQTSHPIASAKMDGGELVLTTKDDLLVGRMKIDAVTADAIMTSSAMAFPQAYNGVTLASQDFVFHHPVRDVSGRKISLAKPLPADHPLKAGQDIWLVNVGVGDKLCIPAIEHWMR